jgi:hypothetical protein
MRCRPAHDVYMSSADNGLPMRSTVAVPVFLHPVASLNFDAPSKLYLGCTIKGTSPSAYPYPDLLAHSLP